MSALRALSPWRTINFLFLVVTTLAICSPCVLAASVNEAASSPAVVSSAAAPTKIPDDIPLRRDATSEGGQAASTVLPTMMVLLGLAVLIVWTVRRKRLSGSSVKTAWSSAQRHPRWPEPLGRWLSGEVTAPVQVLSSQRLTPRHSIHLIQWQGRNYLLGCGEQHITVIDSASVEQRTSSEADAPKP